MVQTTKEGENDSRFTKFLTNVFAGGSRRPDASREAAEGLVLALEEVGPLINSRNDSGAVDGAVGADDLPQEFNALPREFCLSALIDESGVVLKTAQEAEVELGRESLVGGCGVAGEQDTFPVREGE